MSRWWAGAAVLLAALVTVPTQAATTIAVSAKGTLDQAACIDDGTLAGLSAGCASGAIVTMVQSFEVGSLSLLDTVNDPSQSFFLDLMSLTLSVQGGGSLTLDTPVAGDFGDLLLDTAAAADPGLASQLTKLTVANQLAFSSIRASNPLVTSANPLQNALYNPPADTASFGIDFQSAPDTADIRTTLWFFRITDVEFIRIDVTTDGTVPEPGAMVLLLLAMSLLAWTSRQVRQRPHRSER